MDQGGRSARGQTGVIRLQAPGKGQTKKPLPEAGAFERADEAGASARLAQAAREALMRLRNLRLRPNAVPAPRMGRGPGV